MAMMLMAGCSTQKAGWTNVAFHNTTAHYNVWWNGNESYKEGVKLFEKQLRDDYTQILPIYKLGTKDEAMSINPQMDKAIEKGIKAVKKHSINIRGEEHVKYVKESYLLTAYASFYKQDYVTASNTCQMIKGQFSGSRVGDEAAILYARCLTRDRQYLEAEQELDKLEFALGQGNFSSKLKLKLYMAMAESTLPQEKYKKSVEFIKMALGANPDRKTRARLNFILGQIYQKLERRTVASKYYELVLGQTTDYVMEFNARINLASCADAKNTDLAKLEKGLDKMLKDKKNAEYHDQIYYAKGEMYMGVRDLPKAVASFQKSVAVSTNNRAQRAKSSLRLAEIAYEQLENYDMAQTYYDTAMLIITAEYPHYYDIKVRYDILTTLVAYTRVIDRNDSLLTVASMPEQERNELIGRKIEDLKKKEAEAKEQELLQQLMDDAKAQTNTLQGDWYFYNRNTVQQGKTTFRQRWGADRVLEDYWFLSKKGNLSLGLIPGMENAVAEGEDGSEMEEGDTLTEASKSKKVSEDPNDPHNVAYYTKDLPTTTEQRDSMMVDIATGLISAGYIYYDGIRNIGKALECYLRMANEFPEREDVVQAFYMLYRIYDKQGNTPNANFYRDMVLRGFPDSDYANLIRDSEYYKEILKRDRKLNEEYDDLYATYRRRRYGEVINQATLVCSNYPNESIVPKFEYWEALAFARIDSIDRAIAIFTHLVNDHPSTDSIVPLAQAQLDFLKEGGRFSDDEKITKTDEQHARHEEGTELKSRPTNEQRKESVTEEQPLSPGAQLFRFREALPHYVVVIVDDKKIKATELQYRIADFLTQYYSNSGLKVNALMFTDSTQLITIHRLNDATSACDLWRHLMREESPLQRYNAAYYTVYPISQQNYTTFYSQKNVAAYKEFFDRYYQAYKQ